MYICDTIHINSSIIRISTMEVAYLYDDSKIVTIITTLYKVEITILFTFNEYCYY